MSKPQTSIYICSGVFLTNDYQHTIWFDDVEKQEAYFMGKVVKTFSNYTYLRREWSIKVNATVEEAKTWNYLMFRNGTLNTKMYYYFINRIEYISDDVVELFIEMDVMQTYLFDHELRPSFVEREHSATDYPGDNVVDEGLELGEYVGAYSHHVDMGMDDGKLCILVMATFNPMTTDADFTDTTIASRYDGVFGGVSIYAVDMSAWQAWGAVLQKLDKAGKSDGILNMWMYPKALIQLENGESWDDDVNFCHAVKSTNFIFTDLFHRENHLDEDYIPDNKKLLTYPYNMLYVTNNIGDSAVYRFELMGGGSANGVGCMFQIRGTLSPEAQTIAEPTGYACEGRPYEYALRGGGYPTCAWNQDVYKLWLAQNQNQQKLAMVSAGLTIAGGVVSALATGGVGAVAGAGAALHGVTQIQSIMAQRADKEIQPPQARGQYSSGVNVTTGRHGFTFIRRTITKAVARRLDGFFTRFGYQTNEFKTPNRCVREVFTYTKTRDACVTGNICTDDLRRIQSAYDNGVCFWRQPDKFGQYDGSENRPLSETGGA